MYFYKNKIAHIENIFKWGLKQYFFKYQYLIIIIISIFRILINNIKKQCLSQFITIFNYP